MPARWAVPFLLLAAALAGCAQPPDEPEEPETPRAMRLELTDCQGWEATSLPFAPGAGPGKTPPGWDNADPATVHMEGYECQRLSLGRFERGPVRLLIDEHSDIAPPEGCGQDGRHWLLASLWIDDKEVALELEAAYGLPARFSDIEQAVQAGGVGELRTWTWGTGDAKSSITIPEDSLDSPDRAGFNVFWVRGDGVGKLDFGFDGRNGVRLARLVEGTLQPPMLMASAPGGQFVGPGHWYAPGFSATGDFFLYEDLECARPEAP